MECRTTQGMLGDGVYWETPKPVRQWIIKGNTKKKGIIKHNISNGESTEDIVHKQGKTQKLNAQKGSEHKSWLFKQWKNRKSRWGRSAARRDNAQERESKPEIGERTERRVVEEELWWWCGNHHTGLQQPSNLAVAECGENTSGAVVLGYKSVVSWGPTGQWGKWGVYIGCETGACDYVIGW